MLLAAPITPAVGAGINWFATTLTFSTYSNTAFLKAGGSANSLTLWRIGGSTALGTLVQLREAPFGALVELVVQHWAAFAVPALCLFLASYFNSIALSRTGITVTYVTKSSGPVATIALCMLGLGQLPPARALLAVPLVVLGVALSVCSSQAEFETKGFLAACASTLFQQLLGITGKTAMASTAISGAAAQWLMCTLVLAGAVARTVAGAGCGAAVVAAGGSERLLAPARRLLRWRPIKLRRSPPASPKLAAPSRAARSVTEAVVPANTPAQVAGRVPILPFAVVRIMAACAFFLEYSCMFHFASLIDSVTLSVTDTIRRSAIVYTGRALFGGGMVNPLGNLLGLLCALVGAVLYAGLSQTPTA